MHKANTGPPRREPTQGILDRKATEYTERHEPTDFYAQRRRTWFS